MSIWQKIGPVRKNTAIALPESDPLLMRALEQRIVLDAALGETAQDTANETAHSNLAQAYANSVSDDQTAWAHAVALREFGQEDDEPGVLANTDPTCGRVPKRVAHAAW